MLIDWFTVLAQIVNFLILVALLKHFLYGRILRAMDERERKIEAQYLEARNQAQEAEHAIETHRKQTLELKEQRQALLAQAQQEAEALRKKLVEEAREEVGVIRRKWVESLEQEKIAFLQALRGRTAREVFHIARSVLKDLGHVSLEHHMAKVFLQKLRALDEAQWHDISESLGNGANADIMIRTTFELPEEIQQHILEVVQHHLIQQPPVHFETTPELMGGIELKVPGYSVGWSFAHYLDALELELSKALEDLSPPLTRRPAHE